MRKTNKGRVVYNRKIHYFRLRDVVRVLSRVRWDLTPPEELLDESIATLEIIQKEMVRRILEMIEDPAQNIQDKIKRFANILWEIVKRFLSIIGVKLK